MRNIWIYEKLDSLGAPGIENFLDFSYIKDRIEDGSANLSNFAERIFFMLELLLFITRSFSIVSPSGSLIPGLFSIITFTIKFTINGFRKSNNLKLK